MDVLNETGLRRRGFLLVGCAMGALALAACNPAQLAQVQAVAQSVLSDVQLVQNAYAKYAPVLTGLIGVPASLTGDLATLNGYLTEGVTLASSISNAASTLAAQSPAEQLETVAEDAVTLATTPPLSTFLAAAVPGLGPVLLAANVVIPVIAAGVGLATAVGAPSPAELAAARETLKNA